MAHPSRLLPLVVSTALTALLAVAPGCTDDDPPVRLLAVTDAGPVDSSTPRTETFNAVVELSADLRGGSVDFGELECGAPAAAPRVYQVRNIGNAALTWAASLSATNAFALVGPTQGTIAPGATGDLGITLAGVPGSEAVGTVAEASLTITSNAVGAPKIDIKLSRKAAGGTLELTPAAGSFGDVQATTTSEPLALTLSNKGNRPLTVTLGSSSDPHFSVTATGSAPFTVAGGEALPGLSARFAPTVAGALQATVPLQVTGPVCGVSATQIALDGKGVIGVARTTPGALAFGSVNCGTAGGAKTVEVANDGAAPLTYQAALLADGASRYTVAPASGTVAAGQTATLTVTPTAIPAAASTADNAFGGTLRITTNALGDGNHDITLGQTARGAILAIAPETVPFGDVPLGTTTTSPVTLTNSGNAAITVFPAASGAGFGVTASTPVTVEPGVGSTFTARFGPTAVGTASGTATVTAGAGTVLCAPLPAGVALSGRGTNGVLGLSASSLDFGTPNCGTTASAQTFEVRNTGTAPFTFAIAAQRGNSSPYTVTPSNGSVPAGGKVLVTVQPTAIPSTSALTANLYGDTLTITPTGISGGTAQSLTLTESARGAILAFTATPVAFGNVVVGAVSTGVLSVRNTGNAPATVTASDTGADASSFTETNSALLVPAGSTGVALTPRFAPTRTGPHSASIEIAAGPNDALCAPLPTAAALSGTGIKGNLVVDKSAITFGAVSCGAGTQEQSVTLTNNGTAPFTYTAALLGTVGFAVTPTAGSLATGASVILTVTSPSFATTRGNVTAALDTLRIGTNISGASPTDVALSATPRGAILTTSAASVAFGDVVTGSVAAAAPVLTVNNGGNLAAPVTLTRRDAIGDSNRFLVGSGLSAPASGSVSAGLTFRPVARGNAANLINVTVPPGTPLCAALPAGVVVGGKGVAGVFTVTPNPASSTGTCNSTTSPVTLTVGNKAGDAALDWSGSMLGGTVSPASGTLLPGATATVTVTPPAPQSQAPGTTANSTATFTTNVFNDTSRNVTVQTAVQGAMLSWENSDFVQETDYDFGYSSSYDCTLDLGFYVRYRGDAGHSFKIDVTTAPGSPTPTVSRSGKPQTDDDGSIYEAVFVHMPSCGTYDFTVRAPDGPTAGICGGQNLRLTGTVEYYYNPQF